MAAMTDVPSLRAPARVLAINAGSSSIKLALYDTADVLHARVQRTIERARGESLADSLASALKNSDALAGVDAIGHRVVHGGARYRSSARIDAELIRELRRIAEYSPEHLPAEIELIELTRERFAEVPQVACFDTAFHRDMPRVAQLLPLPRRFDAKGVRRFGFHGLSYAFLMEELARLEGPTAARGRVVLAHLGNGSSLAAVRDGRSLDTTMAFTPAAGVPMSTRTGDLDPGIAWFLARTEGMGAEQFHRMVNHESGLLGVSETSSDMRQLLECEATDVRAAEAVEMYCYQIAKAIGALAVVLGGIDTLVFAGGIGENAPPVRDRICARLGFLGTMRVHVIRTDEQMMIARETLRTLQQDGGK
jgi:acetate kinase